MCRQKGVKNYVICDMLIIPGIAKWEEIQMQDGRSVINPSPGC